MTTWRIVVDPRGAQPACDACEFAGSHWNGTWGRCNQYDCFPGCVSQCSGFVPRKCLPDKWALHVRFNLPAPI